eukprot:scaffold4013_cov140-Isochrysis_galbana.AAC.3
MEKGRESSRVVSLDGRARCISAKCGEALRVIPAGDAAPVRRPLHTIEGAEAEGVRPASLCSRTCAAPRSSILAGKV